MIVKRVLAAVVFLAIVVSGSAAFPDGWDPNSSAPNIGGIINTRHNLTMSYLAAGTTGNMDLARNNYGEVCVYCHTPHGANGSINAPLWNRTNAGNTYTAYNIPLTSGQTATQPGVNSLTCLSCHDGTVAVDSVINMPGSGLYNAAQQTASNSAFLDSWPGAGPNGTHGTLEQCTQACHNSGNIFIPFDFQVFVIGTDLTNDHPVGVQMPDHTVWDFNAPSGSNAAMKFFDNNGNGRADDNEPRFYNTGEGYEVECASCHDPHGVSSTGVNGGALIPSFLRVNNNGGSTLCLTCHNK